MLVQVSQRCAVNRILGAFLVILLGAAVGSAQNSTPSKSDQTAPSTVFRYTGQSAHFSGANCPVGLRAQRRGPGNVVIVDGPNRYVSSPGVHLLFDNWQPNSIVAVTVTVHGYDAKVRTLPVGSGDSSELRKTVELNVNVSTGKTAGADLTLQPLATVSRVDLESVEYADGTRWSASEGKTCHVVPDLFMLVAGHRSCWPALAFP